MTAVFADTAFFVALLNPRDTHHQDALEASRTLRRTVTTTDWVIVETGNFVCDSPQRPLFPPFVRRLRANPRFAVRRGTARTLEDALDLYAARPDKSWSLTDCISFVVMREEGLTDALTTDHHFAQAGFKALLL
ncbi:MAG TPA: PIN domain-containing protein [Candidatus Hydrogenedentes bacterium]|nr:PIN domain-containing protein [Candidatus Hydrogenedentota bacterium]HNT89123.1 PIN domain-containing protein [Candidatus Hydrogenedentota bacterium]